MKELDHHFHSHEPQLAERVFVAPSADVIGHVTIGADSSIWFQCVVRGDINSIHIGCESNLQDGSIVHVSSTLPTIIGDRVSCGHKVIVHACTIQDEVLVGMGSTIMDGAEIGEGTIIGAHSLITKETRIPPGVLVVGSPGRVLRELTEEERRSIPQLAEKYRKVKEAFRERQGFRGT